MIKKMFKLLKQLILSFFLLYSFNMIMSGFNFFIPINLFTVITTTIFGFPGLFLILGLLLII